MQTINLTNSSKITYLKQHKLLQKNKTNAVTNTIHKENSGTGIWQSRKKASLPPSLGAICIAALSIVCTPTTTLAAPNNEINDGHIAFSRPLMRRDLIPGAAHGWFVRYATTGVNHERVWSNGVIFEPYTPPPADGYKLSTYGHGAKGIGYQCQPTASHIFNSDPEYQNISALLKKGYVTALTDYPLVNHEQPFLGAYPEATSMLDIVRAARTLDPRISKNILIGGYSQGGQAAFAAASIQKKYAPEFVNHGLFTLAAPAGQDLIVPDMGPHEKIHSLGLGAIIGLVMAGFMANAPQYANTVKGYLTPSGLGIIHSAETGCFNDFWVVGAALTNPAEYFKKPVRNNPELVEFLQNYLRTPLTGITVPTLITQGTSDFLVTPKMSQALLLGLRDSGNLKVTRRLYSGIGHQDIPGRATRDIVRFVVQNL